MKVPPSPICYTHTYYKGRAAGLRARQVTLGNCGSEAGLPKSGADRPESFRIGTNQFAIVAAFLLDAQGKPLAPVTVLVFGRKRAQQW